MSETNLKLLPIQLTGALTGNSNKVPLLGDTSQIVGDASRICGSLNNLKGDVSNLHGNISNVTGDVSGVFTTVSVGKANEKNPDGIAPGVDGIWGDFTGCFFYLTEADSPKGDISRLNGLLQGSVSDVAGLPGDVSIGGDVSNLFGTVVAPLSINDAGKLRGNVTGLTGNTYLS